MPLCQSSKKGIMADLMPEAPSANQHPNGNTNAKVLVNSSGKLGGGSTADLVDGKVVREDVFQCLSRGEQLYRVVLTYNELLLQGLKDHTTIERFSMDDLFGCHTLRHKKTGVNYTSAYICFYLYPRMKRVILCSVKFREKVPLVFEVKKTGNSFEDNLELATKWKEDALGILGCKFPKWQLHKSPDSQTPGGIINKIAISNGIDTDQANNNKNINGTLIPLGAYSEDEMDHHTRPGESSLSVSSFLLYLRRFLVILNPKSGQGKTITIFQEKVSPILTEGGIKMQLLITERAGHARSMISSADLSEIDGIVTVGGDGLLYEVVNGLRSRADSNRIANIPVGVIAGGSGNGLARSVASYSGEAEDYLRNPVLSTTLAAARGKVLPVNLAEVELDGRKIYSFLSAGWGILSDIDVESEVLRGIGESRFTIWSFLRLVKLRSYKARLTFIPWDKESQDRETGNVTTTAPTATESNNSNQNRTNGNVIGERTVIDDNFVCVYSSCQSHIGSDLIFAPSATPNDGLIHLTYIRASAGRASTTQFLLALDKGTHTLVNGVNYVTVKEFSIHCVGGIGGNLTIDGERVTGEHFTVRLARKPLNVFSL